MRLLDANTLEKSAVVANCRMNRERTLTGSNGYSCDLGFNPVAFLEAKSNGREQISWLDLCCGSGRALVEAAQIAHCQGWATNVKIVGVDLVRAFVRPEPASRCLRFVQASLSAWKPDRQFDLVTCVNGLHYIGDKLGMIARAVSWLSDDGLFAANLDLSNCKFLDGRSASRIVSAEFRRNTLQYRSRRKLLTCEGRRAVKFPFRFVGADDEAGPNYTGQPAVDSYYERLPP
ncbi:MAG TPA: class I SAM-dependent methyltransferase [Pirellulales bacterium]|nr:class I SAM-dependent methyltransferase [Pirellulales bacterium]